MDMNCRNIRMAILNADTSTPNTYASMGTFGDILHRVLAEAAWRVNRKITVQHSVFDIVRGEYPGSLSSFDAVVITASASSSYENKSWVQTLEKYIIRLYKNHPDIKIFGSCFGHHIICQALLKDHGLRVEKSPKGWEIGINHVVLTDDFKKTFEMSSRDHSTIGFVQHVGRLPSPDDDDDDDDDDDTDAWCTCFPDSYTAFEVPRTVRLQFVHEDQVTLPSMSTWLPKPWILLGSTEHCAVQGIYQPGRVLTLQGHFEFDKFESRQTEKIFGADLRSVAEKNGSSSFVCGRPEEIDDGYLVAEMVIRFLAEPTAKGSMPTPRTSVEIV